MSKKKILWYVGGLCFSGGGERLLLEGIKYYINKGYDAKIFTAGGDVDEKAFFDGQYSPEFYGPINSSKKLSLRKKMELINNFNPDILIANDRWIAAELNKARVFGFLKKPYVTFVHGSFFQFKNDKLKYSIMYKNKFNKIWSNDEMYKKEIPEKINLGIKEKLVNNKSSFWDYYGLRNSRCIFVLSNKAKNELEYLIDKKNVRVLHGAIPKNVLQYKGDASFKKNKNLTNKTVFFTISRLVPKKRIDFIIKAFSHYIKNDNDAVILIGGTGSEKEVLENLVDELGIKEKVRFLGFVKENEVLDYYNASDVFLLADITDYDITVVVALALDKCVVVPEQCEFEKVIDDENVVFYSKAEVDEYALKMEQAIMRQQKHRKSAELLLSTYTWDYYFEQVENLATLSGKKRGIGE